MSCAAAVHVEMCCAKVVHDVMLMSCAAALHVVNKCPVPAVVHIEMCCAKVVHVVVKCPVLQWSLGVLLWELLTRGCLPFHEVEDGQVKDFVVEGYTLGKPENCSDHM